MFRMLTLAAAFAGGLASVALADGGPIRVDHPWSRAAVGRTGVVYMTIVNTGTADDSLVAAATPEAGEAQLHEEIDDNGVMKMRPVKALPVKAGGQAELKPDGLHIMLVGLKHPLKAGDSFPLTLTFEKAGAVQVTVAIESAGAEAPMQMDMKGMKM